MLLVVLVSHNILNSFEWLMSHRPYPFFMLTIYVTKHTNEVKLLNNKNRPLCFFFNHFNLLNLLFCCNSGVVQFKHQVKHHSLANKLFQEKVCFGTVLICCGSVSADLETHAAVMECKSLTRIPYKDIKIIELLSS